MALSDFWRGNRGRSRDEWSRGERDEGTGFRRRGGWREGSDYYGYNPEHYGAGNDDTHGTRLYGSEGRSEPSDPWRTYRNEYEDSDYGGGESSEASRDRGASFNDRWQNSYGGSGTSSNFRGYGGYGGGDYDERGTYGGYGRSQFGKRPDRPLQSGESGRQEGQFRGRGPKGYRRSDERIREDVCECLTDDERIDASNITVSVKDCEVTLTGTVSTREEKRRAEDLIERLSGVTDVHNQLRVARESEQSRVGTSTPGESGKDIH